MSVFQPSNLALITGGASGVGLAVAQLCLKHAMRVAIVDCNIETLELAKKTLGEKDVKTFEADVADEEAWKGLKRDVEGELGEVDFLMLNAGIGGKGGWGEGEYFRTILATNLFGVINGLNTFVPTFQTRSSTKPSAIVITGSKQGITNPPGNPAYNASKAAVKVLAEHLSFDLRDTKTEVHLLVPGWTFTGLSGNSPNNPSPQPKPAGAWSPSQVADYMYTKMLEKKFYIICPDNDVDEATDKKRMLWSVGDVVNGRPPLTRWREEWKERCERGIGELDV
ncbi:short chain dehydrogenase/reductase [Clohesyomyces aquaticus]|uniref:Short chain dehydrogenase/reductase n=1 Tax=Clohesyomyces aquaticus TaxID=1231657 RepID=A0A1Y1Z3W1_9PLEO|nr:short chain dehydrogenase/reductase [Clohesyomyces aquaticus]